jgi:hypothetical protein
MTPPCYRSPLSSLLLLSTVARRAAAEPDNKIEKNSTEQRQDERAERDQGG